MKQTAQKIRSELLASGIARRDVSVKCYLSGYQIKVVTKNKATNKAKVRQIVERCYYAKEHHWLCCWVDGQMLVIGNKTLGG